MSFLKNLFNPGAEVPDYLEKGAVIIDVRSPSEFKQGHVPKSINIPLDKINSEIERIKSMGKPVIFCCASGVRSGNAASRMKKEGIDCINGGGWANVVNKMK